MRREYTSNTAIEFLHTRKMNEKLISGLELNLPLKHCSFINQEQISSLVYRYKTLKSLSIRDFRLDQTSKHDGILLKNILVHLKTFRCLLNLKLFFLFEDISAAKELDNLTLALKNMTSLRSLDIYFSGENTGRSFDDFLLALRYLGCLAVLKLAFSNVPHIHDGSMKKLAFALKGLQTLSSLTFILDECEDAITDKGVEYLSSALKRVRSLSAIRLMLSPLRSITDQGLVHLSDALHNHQSLSFLHLNLSECTKITNKGILYLGAILQELEALSHLSLSLFRFEESFDHDLTSFFSNLKTIKSIYLPLDVLRSQGLRDAILNLKELTRLQLELFESDELTDETLQDLSLGLRPLQQLRELNLVLFAGERFTNERMRELSSSFKNLSTLILFRLYLYKCEQINDKGIEFLCDSIKSIKNLKELRIELRYMDKITDASLKSIKFCLDGLKASLVTLHLVFECKSVTNKGMSQLFDSLKALHYLSSISLDFSFSGNVDNETILILLLSIKDLPSLSCLKLIVMYNRNIGEKSINSLSALLGDFKALDTVLLSFPDCQASIKNGLHGLAASLKKLSKLSRVVLDFDWNYEIDKELMESLVTYRKDWKVSFEL